MSDIRKPQFTNLQTGQLTRRLDDLRARIEQAKVGDKVDVAKLEESVKELAAQVDEDEAKVAASVPRYILISFSYMHFAVFFFHMLTRYLICEF